MRKQQQQQQQQQQPLVLDTGLCMARTRLAARVPRSSGTLQMQSLSVLRAMCFSVRHARIVLVWMGWANLCRAACDVMQLMQCDTCNATHVMRLA